MINNSYYTYTEVAEALGIKKNTLYTYIWQRKLKPIERKGMRNVFDKAYIDQIVKEGMPENGFAKF